MKKTFPLSAPDRATARVIDAIKHDVRKYVKRERRKPLPEGTDFWTFACKVGPDAATAEPKVIDEVNAAIDAVAAAGATAVHIEVLAVSGHHIRYAAAPLGPVAPVPPADPVTPPSE
jgi:hypothetical protein